jgi:hypothetical protein
VGTSRMIPARSHTTVRAVPHTAVPVCHVVHANFEALSLFRSSCRLSPYGHLNHLPDFRPFQL